MNSVFSKESWEVKNELSSKMLKTENLNSKFFENEVTLKYKKPLFFDDNMRFDIKMKGNISLNINNKNHYFENKNLADICIEINNNSFNCDGINEMINLSKENFLEVTIKSNSTIEKFTIIKDLKINSCNPNN